MLVAEGHRLHRLSGGARLITAPMPARRSASIAFMFAVGSRYEDEASCGLSHFIEHIVFKGAGRYPTARDISEAIESVGGSINAGTDKEATIFYVKVPSEHLELAVNVLGDMTSAPCLDPEEVGKERQVVIEELRMYLDNPQDHVATLFDEVMYPGQPLGWDVAGTEESVRRIDADACREHLLRHYRPERLVVSVAGDVDHDTVAALVDPVIGHPGPALATEPQPADEAGGAALRFVNKRTEQANIMLGAHACSYRDRRRFVLDILNVILGEGMSSRLFLELRERRALAYDVHSFTSKLNDSGYLGIYLGCEPRRGIQATSAAVDELVKVATDPVPDHEMRKAKEYAKGRLLLHLEGTTALGQYLGQQELLADEILLPDEVVAAVEAVTADEVRDLAAEICGHGLRAAVIGPFSKPERFETTLARAS